MSDIPVPISSSPGVRTEEGAGRLINCFAEKIEQGGRFPVVWRRSAGLREVLDINTAGQVHLRGAILVGGALVTVFETRVWNIGYVGGVYNTTNLGVIPGTDPVTLARNNNTPIDIVCVSAEAGCFSLTPSTAPMVFADADLPFPNSVSSLDGYFVWTIGDGRIFASDLNSVNVSSLSWTQEEDIGTLLRGVSFRGEFFAFGEKGTGVYKDVGSVPFPLQRQFQISTGIAGTHAIAGWEDGWVHQLIWVGQDGVVYKLNGYTPEPISIPDVTRAIAGAITAGDGSLLEAGVHMQANHAFWRLTYPGVFSWEYNATTGNWNERQSYGRDDCRTSRSVWAFNRWHQGDRDTGKLFAVDDTYYREGDEDPLIMEIQTGIVANFPARLAVYRADFDFTTAVGILTGEDPIETDPTVQIAWSRDGGYSFGNFVNRKLGREGDALNSPYVNRIGLTDGKGIRFKLRVSDPVHAAFMGGQAAVEPQGA